MKSNWKKRFLQIDLHFEDKIEQKKNNIQINLTECEREEGIKK